MTADILRRRTGSRTRRLSRRRRVSWWLVVPAAALTFLFSFGGVAAGGWYAFTDWNGISVEADFIGLDNFLEILGDPVARGALLNTLKLAAVFVLVVNVLGIAFALALHRALRTRNFLRAAFFAPVAMSPLAVSYIWRYIFSGDGPFNVALRSVGLESWTRDWIGDPQWALWTAAVVLIWQNVGLTMVMYLAGLQSIPEEIDEAAIVDGAGHWDRFRLITFPLLAPAVTIAVTYTLILGMRVFDQIIALTGGGPYYASETLSSLVYRQTFVDGRFGYGSALALVMLTLIIVVTLIQMSVVRWREARI